jgi:peptide deformylase
MWRIFISPVDMMKTTMQVGGGVGIAALQQNVAANGFIVMCVYFMNRTYATRSDSEGVQL